MEKVYFKDLFDVSSGLSKGAKELANGDNPFLTFKTIFSNTFLPDVITDTANTNEIEQEKYSVQRGDVFLTRTSETTNELGMSSVALKDYPNAVFNGFSKRLRLKPEISTAIDLKYLGYFLRSRLFRDQVDAMSNTSTRASLNIEMINRLYLVLPDLSMQEKIGNTLYLLDDKIKNNSAINQNLQKQAKTVFDSIINNTTQSERLSSFISIKHGFAFKGDGIAPEDNGIVLVTPGNFKIGGGFQENKCKFFHSEYSNDYVLQPNDLIITMTDLSKDGDTLGYGALVPCNSDRVYLHNQRIGLVRFLTDTLPKDYVYWFLRSDYYHKCIVGSASGSTVKHTSPSRILEQIIPIPQESDYDKIILLQIIDNTIASNELESIRLQRIRDVLLPRLMSGELDVTSIDI